VIFQGIVQGKFQVSSVEDIRGLRRLKVAYPGSLQAGLSDGASIAVNGVCLTVVQRDNDCVGFDVVEETLKRTNLGALRAGEFVNIERSIKVGDEIGGHHVSGHVDGTAKIVAIARPENNCILTLKIDLPWMEYVFPKGFIALNGASLTVNEPDLAKGTFRVHLIPKTLELCNFSSVELGDRINFEIDRQTQAVVDTVKRWMSFHLTSKEG
jgi:riboflavin synthase